MDRVGTRTVTMTRITALLVATAALLAACTSGTAGQAGPSPTTSDSSPPSSHHASAPQVEHPLDASKVLASPCSALLPSDLSGLHIMNPLTSSHPDATGTDCGWTGSTGGNVNIGWPTAGTSGLSDLYAKSNSIAYWQPVTVSGYPGAFGDPTSDGRAQGECVLHVAVSDHLYFDSIYNNPVDPGPACQMAQDAAVDVIRNLGGS